MKKKRLGVILFSIAIIAIISIPIYSYTQGINGCCATAGSKAVLRQDPANCKYNRLTIPNMAWYCQYHYSKCDTQFIEVFATCYVDGVGPPICENPPCASIEYWKTK